MDTLKSSVQTQIIDFTSKVEEFHGRWLQLLPCDDVVHDDDSNPFDELISQVREALEEWKTLMNIQSKMK